MSTPHNTLSRLLVTVPTCLTTPTPAVVMNDVVDALMARGQDAVEAEAKVCLMQEAPANYTMMLKLRAEINSQGLTDHQKVQFVGTLLDRELERMEQKLTRIGTVGLPKTPLYSFGYLCEALKYNNPKNNQLFTAERLAVEGPQNKFIFTMAEQQCLSLIRPEVWHTADLLSWVNDEGDPLAHVLARDEYNLGCVPWEVWRPETLLLLNKDRQSFLILLAEHEHLHVLPVEVYTPEVLLSRDNLHQENLFEWGAANSCADYINEFVEKLGLPVEVLVAMRKQQRSEPQVARPVRAMANTAGLALAH